MSWRLAKSLGVLRDQFDTLAPDRATDSDGTIGNEAHQATTSDHNPNDAGVVCALDITHDPAHGVDTWDIADQLRLSGDLRIKYVISNHRIANPGQPWRPYNGSNPHDHHMHVSVDNVPGYDRTEPWKFHLTAPGGPVIAPVAILARGSKGERVKYLQEILKLLPADGNFGPNTDRSVRTFQAAHGLVVDGMVGPYTWKALLEGGPATVPVPPIVQPVPIPPPAGYAYGKGSWYSQFKGKYTWVDEGDAPGSAALGVPDNAQGISFYNQGTLGRWFEVVAPNGVTSIEQQTDIGPHPKTGRKIDVSAAAAERFGYTPRNFPTDQTFHWRPIEPPAVIASLSPQQQASKFRDLRSIHAGATP